VLPLAVRLQPRCHQLEPAGASRHVMMMMMMMMMMLMMMMMMMMLMMMMMMKYGVRVSELVCE